LHYGDNDDGVAVDDYSDDNDDDDACSWIDWIVIEIEWTTAIWNWTH